MTNDLMTQTFVDHSIPARCVVGFRVAPEYNPSTELQEMFFAGYITVLYI